MVQSAQDWCGENYSRSFGQFVLAAQHIRRISARVTKDGPLPRISDNRCGASMSQHQKPEDDYLPSSAQSSHLLAYRMAPAPRNLGAFSKDLTNSDSKMQRFESHRLSQAVRKKSAFL
jgi:hypothetical protein